MGRSILVFYGSYRSDRTGIRLARYVTEGFAARGNAAELIDAQAVGLPMLDRMYKEYPKGQAPEAMETLAGKLRQADGFVFVAGEYNWGAAGAEEPHRSFPRGVVLAAGGKRAENAVWSYETPYPAMAAIQGHLAFYPDRVDAIEIG